MLKRKILASIVVIALMASALGIGTYAIFSDTETSVGNSFTAGTLDLKINGVDTNVVAFTVSNMRPGNQPANSFVLSNVGSLNGDLDVSKVVLTDAENVLTEPEIEAGDNTADLGELSSVVNLRLYIDVDKDGYWSTGDVMIFNDKVDQLPALFDLNRPIAAGANIRINAVFDWWGTLADNQAQSDSFTLDLTYQLTQ